MPRSTESSDDEAPEAFTFSTSKKAVQSEEKALQQFHAEEKQKLKEKRRQRDQALKTRKEQAKVRGKTAVVAEESDEDEEEEGESKSKSRKAGGSASKEELEARMERAMKEAQAESGEDDEEDDLDMEDLSGAEDDSASDSGDEDEEMSSGSEDSASDEDEPAPTKSKRPSKKAPRPSAKKDYLPDHLFTSAFSQLPTPSTSPPSKSKKRAASPPPQPRKRTKKSSTDLTIGSRIVRTLPSSTARPAPISARGLTSTAKINHFVNRALNVRGDAKGAKARGWERRAVNVGVLKRNGPAARFVRDE